jgi:hypothetical protein
VFLFALLAKSAVPAIYIFFNEERVLTDVESRVGLHNIYLGPNSHFVSKSTTATRNFILFWTNFDEI